MIAGDVRLEVASFAAEVCLAVTGPAKFAPLYGITSAEVEVTAPLDRAAIDALIEELTDARERYL